MEQDKVYISKLVLSRPGESLNAAICFCRILLSSYNYHELIGFLHPQEQKYYNTIKFEKRTKNYLIGRYAAKRAVAALVSEKNLKNIAIHQGVFTQPIVNCLSDCKIQVSISHCEDFGVAIAFPEAHPMGIDIEEIGGNIRAIKNQITESEKKIIAELPYSCDTKLTFLWTIKEALSKALKTGLMVPLQIYEINKTKEENDCITSYYLNFAQYKSISFKLENYICSIACPKNTKFELDTISLKEIFKN